MVVVCVEGNIGSGKSTALRALAARGLAVREEPVHAWGGLLRRFYEDPTRWALAFSLRVLLGMHADKHAAAAAGGAVVLERSPLSARHVFAQLLFNDGTLTAAEWDLYKEYWEVLGWTPDLLVYVDTPADECYRRMRQRDRPEERRVDVQYIKRLQFQHETMLRYVTVPVVRVDGTKTPEEVAAAIYDVVVNASSPMEGGLA